MSAEAASQPFTAKLVKLSTPPQAVVAGAEASARNLLADAQAQASARIAEAEGAAAAIVADARANAQARAERECAETLLQHRAALARDMSDLKTMLGELIAEAVEKIVGLTPAPIALASATAAVLKRLDAQTAIVVRADPLSIDNLRAALSSVADAPPLKFEVDFDAAPGRATLVGAGVRVEVEVAAQIEMFKALARGEA